MSIDRLARIARLARMGVVPLLLAFFAGCCCCGRFTGQVRQAAQDTANRIASHHNVAALTLAIIAYRDQNNAQWPDSLEQLKPSVPNFDQLMANPVTNDNPGYEYVKPADDADLANTVIIYQLRGGARDESLEMGYGDGTVRGGAAGP